MANCTISTMAVNDCHLQFFDSLGNLIYEFDLETIIALNNGNGILIKDELTTLTIDKTTVVDNLELTIDELITYIQEQRVLCDCCISPSEQAASSVWGYDDSTLNDVLIITNSNGSVSYESPIGNPYTPTGTIYPIQRKARDYSGIISLVSTGVGSTVAGAHRVIFTWDSGIAPTINGVIQTTVGFSGLTTKIFDATILGDGQYVGLPSSSFDGSAGSIVIDQLIL
jgi:hypothetical protein